MVVHPVNAFCADSTQVMQVKNMFYVFSYDKGSSKFCARFRFFLAVFMEKFPKNPFSELCEKRNKHVLLIAKSELTQQFFCRQNATDAMGLLNRSYKAYNVINLFVTESDTVTQTVAFTCIHEKRLAFHPTYFQDKR